VAVKPVRRAFGCASTDYSRNEARQDLIVAHNTIELNVGRDAAVFDRFGVSAVSKHAQHRSTARLTHSNVGRTPI